MCKLARRDGSHHIGQVEGNRTNRDIGAALFISESTVKFHVHAILSKLDASNRTEAVSMAVQQGVISLPSAG